MKTSKNHATMIAMWFQPYLRSFSSQLYDNVLPFWMDNSPDKTYGGYLHQLDRYGRTLSTNKGSWAHGRFLWILSWLYDTHTRDARLLDVAALGYRFLKQHGRDSDGRWWYELTQDGRPLRKRRYLFSEVFATLGTSAWAHISEEPEATALATRARGDLTEWLGRQSELPQKYVSEHYPVRSHAMTMIFINLYQELRRVANSQREKRELTEQIERLVKDIFHFFFKSDEGALLELVADDGSIIDLPEGREINPGHAIETCWFLLEEAQYRSDDSLATRALEILDSALKWGWDQEYGGIFSFLDLRGRPSYRVEWDMKYWWPHSEALYATLLAYHVTGEDRWRQWFSSLADYTLDRFPDPEEPEWFGYLHRDGSVANTLKGSLWKGPFHIPRALAKCIAVFEDPSFSE